MRAERERVTFNLWLAGVPCYHKATPKVSLFYLVASCAVWLGIIDFIFYLCEGSLKGSLQVHHNVCYSTVGCRRTWGPAL